MDIKIVEKEGVEEAIDETVKTFFSGDRQSVEEHFAGHVEGSSSTLLGYRDGELLGILTIRWESRNPVLRRKNIPLIQNIEVKYGRRGEGIGNELMEHAERFAAARTDRIAICVSLSEAYGPAQRLYIKRGYIPDAQGFTKVYEPAEEGGMCRLEPLQEGQEITVGGDILMWLIKELKK